MYHGVDGYNNIENNGSNLQKKWTQKNKEKKYWGAINYKENEEQNI